MSNERGNPDRVNPDVSAPGFDPNSDVTPTRMDRSRILKIVGVLVIVVAVIIVVVLVIGDVSSSSKKSQPALPNGGLSYRHISQTEATALEPKLAAVPGVQNSAYYSATDVLQVFFTASATDADRAKARAVVAAGT